MAVLDLVIVGVNSVAQLRELLAVEPLPWTDRWAVDVLDLTRRELAVLAEIEKLAKELQAIRDGYRLPK